MEQETLADKGNELSTLAITLLKGVVYREGDEHFGSPCSINSHGYVTTWR
jgi:hypothetical protein